MTDFPVLVRHGPDSAGANRVVVNTHSAEKITMKNMRASVAIAVLASILTGSFAFAKNPEPAPVGKSSSPAATPPSSEPSDADRVKNWTKKEWNEAVKEWAQDKAKWEGRCV